MSIWRKEIYCKLSILEGGWIVTHRPLNTLTGHKKPSPLFSSKRSSPKQKKPIFSELNSPVVNHSSIRISYLCSGTYGIKDSNWILNQTEQPLPPTMQTSSSHVLEHSYQSALTVKKKTTDGCGEWKAPLNVLPRGSRPLLKPESTPRSSWPLPEGTKKRWQILPGMPRNLGHHR